MNRMGTNKVRWLMVVALTLLLALLSVSPAAATRTISGEDVVIEAGEVIDDDVVFTGNSLVVDGTIKGDLIAFGSEITINGTVEGDVLAAGMAVTINGEVMDDVRAGAYLVQLGHNAVVEDNALLAGYSVEVTDGSQIDHDLIFAGYQGLLSGEIAGDVAGSAGAVKIDGTIGGDAELEVGAPGGDMPVNPAQFSPQMPAVASVPSGLTVASGASIGGDLTYTSEGAGSVDEQAVGGNVDFTLVVPEVEAEPAFRPRANRPGEALQYVAGRRVLMGVRRFITLTLVGLLLVWLGPKLLTTTVGTFKSKPWASLGIGFVGYVVIITALFLIPWLLIVLGIVLGIISLGGFTPAVIGFGALGWSGLFVSFLTAISWLAKIVLGFWLGQLIYKAISPEGTSLVAPLLIGVAIAAVLTAIPVLGGLLGFVIALFGLGAIILTLRARLRPPQEPAGEPSGEPEPAAV